VPDDDATASLAEHHRYHHHDGLLLFVAMSLDTLGVSPEQHAAVERIRTTLHTRMEPSRATEHDLLSTLADGLASANVDVAKVDSDVAKLSAAAAVEREASADALNELHGMLTPAERVSLVEKVESHLAVWQTANASETERGVPRGDRLALLTTQLQLSPDQEHQIRAGLGHAGEAEPRLGTRETAATLHSFEEAFEQDDFDARALTTTASSVDARMARWGAARMARLVEVASSVLTQDQRARLAATLRGHARHDPSAEGQP
jgi:Spy/CpxP family protein refolding chaperone